MIVFIGWSMQPYSLKGGKVVKDDNFQQVKIFFFFGLYYRYRRKFLDPCHGKCPR